GGKWHVNGAHERGMPHALSWREYFHWDLGATIDGDGYIPDADPADLVGEWVMHPNYDPAHNYTLKELPNSRITWGQQVYSCGEGTVRTVINDQEDNFPYGDRTLRGVNFAGNQVIIDHGGGEYGL